MSKTTHEISTISLAGTQNGTIEVATLSEPYGAGSSAVASIGIFLSGGSEEPDWKVHIPVANLDALIDALQEAKKEI